MENSNGKGARLVTENKKIAIIIPAYNLENYIEQCLDSLVEQTYQNIEIIVVNDGSKDRTLEIVKQYAQKDARIKIIDQENQGLSESRNHAMDVVDSDYVMFVDGDDWLDCQACEKCVKEMQEEEADLVWFSYVREYEKKAIPKGAFEEDRIVFEGDAIKKKLQRRIYGPYREEIAHPEKLDALSPVWGKLYKKEVLLKHAFKSFREIGATCEDIFFNTEVLEDVKKVVYINQHDYHYRKFNPISVTKSVERDLFEKWKKAYHLLNKKIEEKNYDESYKEALKNRFALNFYAIGLRIKNGKNPFLEKYQMIKNILHDEEYVQAVMNLELSYMPLHWRVFFWNAKRKITPIVYLLLWLMSKMASRK